MSWKDNTNFNNINDLFKQLLDICEKNKLVAFRGQADKDWLLQTSLDRILDSKIDYSIRLAEESALIEKFCVLVREYVDSLERNFLYRRLENLPNVLMSSLAVMQHYHAPTRLLDWTSSPWVALYFAAIDHHDKPGAIWWFNQTSFEVEVRERWKSEIHNMDRYRLPPKIGQVNLDATAFSTDGRCWITKLHYPIPFHRIEVQQGFFTVAGRLGFEHGELIANIFDHRTISEEVGQVENQYSRIIIPSLWKQEILDRLRNMCIYSKSLDYPGADIVGNYLTNALKHTYRNANKVS
ncbi:MAG: FRG domain-containing protein [Sedimentisphaerales bacterium]|nr:FRG domain-containing protein [Sedimentisphaerales bacterium]